ncbi:hypothetical protein C0Q70_17560 [Pomacea canaliculata]|uniref:Uncharacterized protein n=1 Tax=Pomacea canaliculata TaxID=400727 RepID=A0A2T7NKS0_POMCA|nr:uncharacterized protein LOC112576354 isoform X3 [Pomacea canaliculata]XP_025114514.1 uncharacterized protein LOC112576354 isoform X3 [Pomacea canaliculata]PVD21759.1 hypothetical protein C0Q70_17560 [Pomacea canaliculata]
MDEGRLAMVLRRVEQQRKYVYMVNDIVRAQHGLLHGCLAREEREATLKLTKSTLEVRRAIVRQRVLLQCLDMRRRKVLARDPTPMCGAYGGKPLWAMSRDIDHVIADNHPRMRRMRRVRDIMRRSLETGAILDKEAVSRRMDEFFEEKKKQDGKNANRRPAEEAPRDRKRIGLPPLGNKAQAFASLAIATNGGKNDQRILKGGQIINDFSPPVEVQVVASEKVVEKSELKDESEQSHSLLKPVAEEEQNQPQEEQSDFDNKNDEDVTVETTSAINHQDDHVTEAKRSDQHENNVNDRMTSPRKSIRNCRDDSSDLGLALSRRASLVLPPIQITQSLASVRKS